MILKRFFSTQPSRRLFIEILNENSGIIIALGVVGSGIFGIGLYVNQMKVYEEKLNVYQEKINKMLSFVYRCLPTRDLLKILE
jgi:hypothetical protein